MLTHLHVVYLMMLGNEKVIVTVPVKTSANFKEQSLAQLSNEVPSIKYKIISNEKQ